MIKLSVVIPIYNMEQYIKLGVEKILTQNLTDIEIILVNDGSTDKSKEICDECSVLNSKIKVIHKENGGAGSARNKGIEVAQGQYIMFLDIDDIIEDGIFEIMLNAIEENKVDLVICNHNSIKNNYIISNAKKITENYTIFGKDRCKDTFIELLQRTLIQTPWDKIYKLDIIRKNNIYFSDLRRCQDAVFNCKYFSHICSYHVISECLYNYRENDLINQWTKFPLNYFDICLELDYVYRSMLKQSTIDKDSNATYLATYFLDEVIQCIKYSFSPRWNFSLNERKKYVSAIIENSRVQEALSLYQPNSLFKKVILIFMKLKSVQMIILFTGLNVYMKLKFKSFFENVV